LMLNIPVKKSQQLILMPTLLAPFSSALVLLLSFPLPGKPLIADKMNHQSLDHWH